MRYKIFLKLTMIKKYHICLLIQAIIFFLGVTAMAKQIDQSTSYLSIGNPQALSDFLNDIGKRKPEDTSPVNFSPDSLHYEVPVVTENITGVDVNHDGYDDTISVTKYRIGYGTQDSPYKWISFQSLYLGKMAQGNSDAKQEIEPDKVDASISNSEPTADFAINSAIAMASGDKSSDSLDLDVALGTSQLMSFAYASFGYLELVEENRKDLGETAAKIVGGAERSLTSALKFAIPSLQRVLASNKLESDQQQNLQNMMRLFSSAPDIPERAKAYGMWMNPQKYDEHTVPHDDLYNEILTRVAHEKGPSFEALYLRNKAYFMEQQRARGGFFEDGANGFIAKANQFAKARGYANYAELRVKELYGISVMDFKATAEKMLTQNKAKIDADVVVMRQYKNPNKPTEKYDDPARPVWELNMWYYYDDKRMRALNELGIKDEPTLSTEEALTVAKAFYKDMGFDIDKMGQQIILDPWDREKKPGTAYQVPIGDGSINVILATYSRGGRISIGDFGTLIHELGHAFHWSTAASKAQGNPFGGAVSESTGVRETYGKTFERFLLTKEFMDSYLSGLPQFKNPKVREVLAKEYSDQHRFLDSVDMARALWEINLYESADQPMDKRLDYWGELGIKYLGYDDVKLPTSKTSFYDLNISHPVHNPLQYLSYQIGLPFSERVIDDLVAAYQQGNSEQKQVVFGRLKSLFEQSAHLFSIQDVESEYQSMSK